MLNLLYEDNFIVVAVKPAGLLSEEAAKDSFPTLLCEELNSRRTERGEEKLSQLFTVHRLDRETEGIMVYALNEFSAAKLGAQIQSDEWKKIYRAVLCSSPKEESGRLCDLLYYDKSRGKAFAVDRKRKGVKEAVLDYSVTEHSKVNGRCTVKIELGTGRTHQIRVQFASRRMPLCGDRRYGAPASSGKRLALCATELSFCHPKSKERLNFSIDAPTEFNDLLNESI